MTPEQWTQASRDRGDLEWLVRRLQGHAERARGRGEATLAANLERVARSLDRARSVPPPPEPEPPTKAEERSEVARRASARSPWRGRAVLPARGHGGGR